MPTLRFNPLFMILCREYVKRHPRVARNPKDFVRRCGRYAAYMLEENLDLDPWRILSREAPRNLEKLVAVYIPREDADKIRSLLEKYGIFKTLSSFYYFSALMVLLGNWELPPRI